MPFRIEGPDIVYVEPAPPHIRHTMSPAVPERPFVWMLGGSWHMISGGVGGTRGSGGGSGGCWMVLRVTAGRRSTPEVKRLGWRQRLSAWLRFHRADAPVARVVRR